jgi:hypothetical protein
MVTLADLLRERDRLTATHPDYPVGILRLSRSEFYNLTADAAVARHQTAADAVAILGWSVLIDPYLPRRVWRLCTTGGALLYDCREGTTPK